MQLVIALLGHGDEEARSSLPTPLSQPLLIGEKGIHAGIPWLAGLVSGFGPRTCRPLQGHSLTQHTLEEAALLPLLPSLRM